MNKISSALLFLSIFLAGCANKKDAYVWYNLEVTVTAYNSVPSQTLGDPNIAAWGDSLQPHIKSIAVSRDLLELGLKHNTPVKIEGFEEVFLVKDKMHKRWKNRIDMYMGTDVEKAKAWGIQTLKIQYGILKDSAVLK